VQPLEKESTARKRSFSLKLKEFCSFTLLMAGGGGTEAEEYGRGIPCASSDQ
jgi:hypothetical protein